MPTLQDESSVTDNASTENSFMSINEAARWASRYLGKEVSSSNISYLIQYGRVPKRGDNGCTQVCKEDLQRYYDSFCGKREIEWKDKLGSDLNWALSFDNLRESDRQNMFTVCIPTKESLFHS